MAAILSRPQCVKLEPQDLMSPGNGVVPASAICIFWTHDDAKCFDGSGNLTFFFFFLTQTVYKFFCIWYNFVFNFQKGKKSS